MLRQNKAHYIYKFKINYNQVSSVRLNPVFECIESEPVWIGLVQFFDRLLTFFLTIVDFLVNLIFSNADRLEFLIYRVECPPLLISLFHVVLNLLNWCLMFVICVMMDCDVLNSCVMFVIYDIWGLMADDEYWIYDDDAVKFFNI